MKGFIKLHSLLHDDPIYFSVKVIAIFHGRELKGSDIYEKGCKNREPWIVRENVDEIKQKIKEAQL